MWIDIHTHLNMLEISAEEALAAAQGQGVERLITIGTEPKDHPIVFDLAQKHFPVVSCTLGVHPHEAKMYTLEGEKFIREKAHAREVVAIGEIGLDYHYDYSDREQQRKVFRRQLELAADLNLPVEVHTREAEKDTVDILRDFQGSVRGVFHCFTGSQWLAEQGLDLGWNISFSGIVTFKSASELREVARYVPLDRLHIETDAPYLAPVPLRGRKNQPAYVVHTADCMAQLRGLSLQELAAATKKNAMTLFPKLSWA